ncbi:hypothetical protein [Wolbachia endosymbiont (group A) of Barypeithes pellucidus]
MTGDTVSPVNKKITKIESKLPRLCGQNFREAIQEPRQNLENP